MPSVKSEIGDLNDLGRRAQWDGILPNVPRLTDGERAEWNAYRRGQSSWLPQRGLHCGWHSVDRIWGSRPWSRDLFMAALAEDRREIESVIRAHPHQRHRLMTWLAAMERFAIEYELHAEDGVGEYYTRLSDLGYDALDTPDTEGI